LLYTEDQVHHRFIEAQKFAFAQRTLLADGDFVPKAKELAENMTLKEYTEQMTRKITDRALELKEYGGIAAQVMLKKSCKL
jgi:gamma-glutamyltranspeptidase